mmetsp:Transcript_9436/g.34323  ORF Transcript_9436/g.34323 Transcript_9436/m.34323 type:complete len:82 (+) Transcript_9436:904-1149(+)
MVLKVAYLSYYQQRNNAANWQVLSYPSFLTNFSLFPKVYVFGVTPRWPSIDVHNIWFHLGQQLKRAVRLFCKTFRFCQIFA